ncbi:energy-coupling factor transporter transmembrane component T family protein [Granulicatella sp.]
MRLRINPSVQLVISFILSIVILFTKSWELNIAMMLSAIVIILLFRRQTWLRIVKLGCGLSVITIIYFLSVYLHPNENILVHSVENRVFLTSLELSSRILALGFVGISLTTSIDKNEFIASLIKQLRVPVEIAFSILVSINFLTLIQTEYEQSKLALRIRGVSGRTVYFKALTTMLIRLIRQSEYTAMAMELRGFSKERIQRLNPSITSIDLLYSSCMISFVVVIIWFYV